MGHNRIAGIVIAASIAALPVGLSPSAHAQISSQVQATQPAHMLVTNPQAMVRCGAGMAYYPVSELSQNTILLMDGETQNGWTRVAYPESASALVRKENVSVSPDGKSLTLNREDALIAYNALNGAKGSWSKLLENPLPRGTKLTITGEATNAQTGELIGYQVEAPEQARGYVRTKFLRPATPAEVTAWESRGQGDQLAEGTSNTDTPTPSAADTEPDTVVAQDEGLPAVDPGATPANENVADAGDEPPLDPAAANGAESNNDDVADAAEETNLIEPMVDPEAEVTRTDVAGAGENDAPNAIEEPATSTDETEVASADEAATDAGSDEAAGPAPLRIGSIEELEEIFAKVQKQRTHEAEYGPLVAEVERMYEETPDTPENAGLRAALQQRLSLLKIRQRVQEAARSNEAAISSAQDREGELVGRIRELEIRRSYAVVGRLLPSAVYDGQRLPRMYRVQSVDNTEAPRTLGYLRPSKELNLETMLGETIGVVGTPKLDPRLNLRIIEPIKIDLIHSREIAPASAEG